MGKCNLFKPINNPTGTFFMFSQYAEDLTKENSQKTTYKVVPSKYYALDLDVSGYTATSLGELFQNHFENACSFFRMNESEIPGGSWNPEMSRNVLWNMLINEGIAKTDGSVITSLKYIGDINIYSYEENDGVGYNEIYCYIPNDAKQTVYECTTPQSVSLNYKDDGTSDFPFIMGYPSAEQYDNAQLSWHAVNEYGEMSADTSSAECYYVMGGVPTPDKDVVANPSSDDSFNINAMLLLYDVYDVNGNIIYRDIPLGIYFTGAVVDGVIENSITKYVSNDNIYGQGTSYGLRVMSRYLCTPNATLYRDSVVEFDDLYPQWAATVDKISKSQDLMNEIISQVNNQTTSLNDHLALFKDNKTNVPYLRLVNGTYYWFVNGKSTGVPVQSTPGGGTSNNISNSLNNTEITNQNGIPILTYDSDVLKLYGEEIEIEINNIWKNLKELKQVAFSGSYNDLSDLPGGGGGGSNENIRLIFSEIDDATAGISYSVNNLGNLFKNMDNSAAFEDASSLFTYLSKSCNIALSLGDVNQGVGVLNITAYYSNAYLNSGTGEWHAQLYYNKIPGSGANITIEFDWDGSDTITITTTIQF